MSVADGASVALGGQSAGIVDLRDRRESWSSSAALRGGYLDRLLAAILLLILLPVFLLIAVLIKLGSKGPVFYTQKRVGLHGAEFDFIKFRSMIVGAHGMRGDVIGSPDEDISQRYRRDPRITRIGAFLRRWSLDELPQLVNVARGDMVLVGPRPILPEELALLEPHHHQRHDCQPGLTGLWQVSGRKDTSWEERMDLDLEYVRNHSASYDLKIIRRTVGVIARGDGAY